MQPRVRIQKREYSGPSEPSGSEALKLSIFGPCYIFLYLDNCFTQELSASQAAPPFYKILDPHLNLYNDSHFTSKETILKQSFRENFIQICVYFTKCDGTEMDCKPISVKSSISQSMSNSMFDWESMTMNNPSDSA